MHKESFDDFLYPAAICTVIVLILFFLVYFFVGEPDIFNCYIKEHFGMYCPGCGCTRSFFSLIRGDFVKSFMFNPTVLYASGLTFFYIVSQTLGRLLKRKNAWFVLKYRVIYVYVGIGIMLITCLVKNIF